MTTPKTTANCSPPLLSCVRSISPSTEEINVLNLGWQPIRDRPF